MSDTEDLEVHEQEPEVEPDEKEEEGEMEAEEETEQTGDAEDNEEAANEAEEEEGAKNDKADSADHVEQRPAVTPKHSVPRITPLDDEKIDLEEIQRKRYDKDQAELQTLISAYYERRKHDEEELEELRVKIATRKSEREDQIRIRQIKEKERMLKEREERKKKEEEEEVKRQEEEARKKAAIANMSRHYGGYLARAEKSKPNRRQTERERKRKYLADRRKPLNIDHLSIDKLREKAQELWDFLYKLEDEKYDHEQSINRQKYDINQLRQRVSEYMGKSKRTGSVKIPGHVGVGAVAGAFRG